MALGTRDVAESLDGEHADRLAAARERHHHRAPCADICCRVGDEDRPAAREHVGGERVWMQRVGAGHDVALVENEAGGVDAEPTRQQRGQPGGDPAEGRRLGECALRRTQRLVALALASRTGGEAAHDRTRHGKHDERQHAFCGRARGTVALDFSQHERPERERRAERGE